MIVINTLYKKFAENQGKENNYKNSSGECLGGSGG